jgi:pimeloyl-ACP methyl ester carboxylesterase
MPKVQLSGGISIHYEDSALAHPDHASRAAILLIHGLGMQLIAWPDNLVDRLIQRGFRVIRMDNRDIGLSSFLDDRPTPILRVTLCSVVGLPVGHVPYTLADMANDAVAVLDACGVDRAHVVGASMGGMIGQWMAVNHAKRVQSLTSIMSSTGARPLHSTIITGIPSLALSSKLPL